MVELLALHVAMVMAAAPYPLLALFLAWYGLDAALVVAEGLGGSRRWTGVIACLGLDIACGFFLAVLTAGLSSLSHATRDAAVIYARVHPGERLPELPQGLDMAPVTVLIAAALVLTVMVRDRRERRSGSL